MAEDVPEGRQERKAQPGAPAGTAARRTAGPDPTAPAAGRERSFEEGMRDLDGIVSKLEQGTLPLEQALGEFETGVALLRTLHEKLGEVEQRVEVLLRDADGVLRVREAGDLTR